jgi:ABC-type lipoprotein release transport system permease subunit
LQIQQELGVQYPDVDGRMEGVTVKPLREALNFAWDMLSISFKVLLGAAAFVLMIAGVMLVFLAVSVFSSFLPAARAPRTDPATVLRSE